MKIIPQPTPAPTPEPREPRAEHVEPPAPMAALPDLKEQLKDLLQEFAAHTVGEMQTLEQKMTQAENKQADQIARNGQAIIRLAEELGALKKTLDELRSEPPPTPPTPEPPRPDPIVPEALNTITQAIAKLSDEMSGLRKTMVEFKTPEPVKIAAEPIETAPPDEPKPAAPSPLHDLMSSMSEPPKKVALLTKLWDYLNQVAFEIPLGKQSH